MQSKRMKGSAAYYKRLQNKHKGQKFTMEELDEMAATKMQSMWRGQQARRRRLRIRLGRSLLQRVPRLVFAPRRLPTTGRKGRKRRPRKTRALR